MHTHTEWLVFNALVKRLDEGEAWSTCRAEMNDNIFRVLKEVEYRRHKFNRLESVRQTLVDLKASLNDELSYAIDILNS